MKTLFPRVLEYFLKKDNLIMYFIYFNNLL